MTFLKSLFLTGITVQGADFFNAYLVHFVWMLIFCLLLVYVILMTIVAVGLYTRPESVREWVDTESRIRLCAGWSTCSVMLLLVGILAWIYYNGVLQPQPEVWLYVRPLAAHATVLIFLFLLWLAVYWGVYKETKGAQALLR
jgi:uncharacterized membrane protein